MTRSQASHGIYSEFKNFKILFYDLVHHSSAVELGIYVSHANRLGPLEVVCTSQIQAPLALCTVQLRRPRIKVWISVSYDKASSMLNKTTLNLFSRVLIAMTCPGWY